MGDTPRGGFVREYEQERSVPVRECVVYHGRVSASNSESVTIHRCDRFGSVRVVVSCCVVVESHVHLSFRPLSLGQIGTSAELWI